MDTLWTTHTPTTDNGPYASAFEGGARFHVNASCYLRAMRWYRKDTTGAEAINGWRLWDVTNHQVVYTPADIPDSGAVGWQVHTVTALVLLSPGIVYTVSRWTHAGGKLAINTAGPGWSPDALLGWDANAAGYTAGAPGEPIATVVNTETEGIDVTVDATAPVQPAPPTLAQIDAQTAEWQSTDGGVNTHEADGIPWLLKTELAATKILVEGLFDLTKSADGIPRTSGDFMKAMTGPIIAAAAEFFPKSTTQLVGPDTAGGSAFYTADGALVSQLVAQIWQRLRVLRNDLPFGVSPWTMTAEEDFADAIAFAQPADAYVLSITSYQETQPATESPAGLWLPRLGWWCVLTGTLASQRQFVDFQEELLSDGGRRMAGAAIQLRPGTLATVQAWVLA